TSLPLLWPPLLALGLRRYSWSLRSSLFTFCEATTPRVSAKRQGHKMGTERGRAEQGQAAPPKVQESSTFQLTRLCYPINSTKYDTNGKEY
ncbi:unnamed protein product, partial [Gulo gulo]